MTITVASCASGCPFHSTVGDSTCRKCKGPMSAPQAMNRDQFLTLMRNEDAYQSGKRAHCAAVGIILP